MEWFDMVGQGIETEVEFGLLVERVMKGERGWCGVYED